MYVEMLRWRRSSGMKAIRAALLAANPAFFERGGSTLEAIYLSETDRGILEEIYPRTWCRPASASGGYAPLLDRHGNLLYIEAPAFVSWPEVAAAGAEAYTLAALRSIELLQLVLDELTRRSGRLVLTLRVLDFLDYRVVNPFKGSKEKEGERIAKEVSGSSRRGRTHTAAAAAAAAVAAAAVAAAAVAAAAATHTRITRVTLRRGAVTHRTRMQRYCTGHADTLLSPLSCAGGQAL